MTKSKLSFISIILLVSVAVLNANPMIPAYTNVPEPVRGMEYLQKQIDYPSFEKEIGRDGYVVLNFNVDVIGNISNMVVVQSASPQFDKSAISAVMSTDWNPAMQNGKAVPVRYSLPIEFHAK